MMIFDDAIRIFIFSALAICLIIQGVLIYKFEQIKLIHSYHYDKFSDNIKKQYAQDFGKHFIFVGLAIILSNIISVFNIFLGWLCIILSLTFFFVRLIQIQRKYDKKSFRRF